MDNKQDLRHIENLAVTGDTVQKALDVLTTRSDGLKRKPGAQYYEEHEASDFSGSLITWTPEIIEVERPGGV